MNQPHLTTATYDDNARPSFTESLGRRPLVLDGGLATLLEQHGHDLSSDLWSARLLREDPDAITRAHEDYFRAGAEVAITSSYQASFEGFAELGLSRDEAARLLQRSVSLAQRARDRTRPEGWVAASVGPFGAVLADGAEYRGDYLLSVAELRAFHRPRLHTLVAAGPDVLAVETIPCLAEVEAVLAELDGIGVPAWLSLTAVGDRTRQGEPLADVAAMVADVAEVIAVGVNCLNPTEVPVALASLAPAGKPLVAYPNSGQTWDGPRRVWVGESAFEPDQVRDWLAGGAGMVGGCCRVGPAEITALAAIVQDAAPTG